MRFLATLLLVLLLSPAAFAQTGALMPYVFPTFVNVNGVTPVANGFVCTTATGGSTPLATFSDSDLTIANQNPIHLNAGGQPTYMSAYVSIYLQATEYRFTLYAAGTGNDCNGNDVGTLIRQVDHVYDLAQFISQVAFPVENCASFTGADAAAKINACIAALPSSGGVADARGLEGAQTISSATVAANKPVQLLLGGATFTGTASPMFSFTATSGGIQGIGVGLTILKPTSATAIAINPAAGDPISIESLSVDMSAATGSPAITANNLYNGLMRDLAVSMGTYGIDLTNTGVSTFKHITTKNNTLAGIRLQGDGGQEDTFDDIWIINDAGGVSMADGFLLSRTNNTDTGGLYTTNLRVVQNGAGGGMTHGIRVTSSSGSITPLFGFFTDCVVDGITAGASILFNNIYRGSMSGCHVTNGSTASSGFAAFEIDSSAQLDVANNLFASVNASNPDIKLSGSIDYLQLIGNRLFGSGTGGTGHIYVNGSPPFTHFTIRLNTWDPTTFMANDESDLKAGSDEYDNLGAITLSKLLTVGNQMIVGQGGRFNNFYKVLVTGLMFGTIGANSSSAQDFSAAVGPGTNSSCTATPQGGSGNDVLTWTCFVQAMNSVHMVIQNPSTVPIVTNDINWIIEVHD